jgi:predicted dehydrogenase
MDVLLVGIGSIGEKEIFDLEPHPKIRIVGAVDTNESRRRELRAHVQPIYESLEEALEQTDPDLVRIATPPRTHHALTKLALNAGCDVYIEKIMTLNTREARDIVETADKLDQSVYVRRNAIYTPVYQRAWSKLDEIGDVRHIHWIEPVGEYSDWSDTKGDWLRDLPGGIVSEHLPHALYTVRWFLREEPVVSQVQYYGNELYVTLNTENKTAEISYVSPSDLPMILDITGKNGSFRVNHSTMRIHSPRGFENSKSVEARTIKANLHGLLGVVKNMTRLSQHYLRRELNIYASDIYSKSDNYRQFSDIEEGNTEDRHFSMNGLEGLKNVELFESIWKETDEEQKLYTTG